MRAAGRSAVEDVTASVFVTRAPRRYRHLVQPDGHASIPQVFVVGTGRSGTATIAALLGGVPGCRVVHELTPPLLAEVTAFHRGVLHHRELVDLLRRTRQPGAIGGTTLSGEANQRLSFVLPALAEAFPHARIVWLLRDGRDAIASMHHRLWYHPRESSLRPPAVRPWALNRIQADQVHDLPRETWARFDRFARCCWYWSYTNRLIEQDGARIDLPVLALRLERLGESLPALWSFLGLDGPLPARLPHRNPASAGRPLGWRLWSPRQRETFRRLCGPTMDRFYPGWEAEMRPNARQGVGVFLRREMRTIGALVTARSRPLRARVGLVRSVRPAKETAS